MQKSIRKRVSVVVVHRNQVLAFHAKDPTNGAEYFFLPGGVIEPGESVEQTAIRETFEETGYSIQVVGEEREYRDYEFEWDGKLNHCQTWYLKGELEKEIPEEVDDTSYNLGRVWVPLENVNEVFGYHPDILEPIQMLTNET